MLGVAVDQNHITIAVQFVRKLVFVGLTCDYRKDLLQARLAHRVIRKEILVPIYFAEQLAYCFFPISDSQLEEFTTLLNKVDL